MLKFIEKAFSSVKINPYYDIKYTEIVQLRNQIRNTNDISLGVIEAFVYGYYKGQTALKSELKTNRQQ